jgi:LysR family transcriptional regulator, hydrogen peroxide-inducible genes activator
MQMHEIRYFLALAEELNFTRAAKRCGVSQPSLTNAIAALERRMGGALFRRKPRVTLTPLGYAVRPRLRQTLQSADAARQIARAFADGLRAAPTTGSDLQSRRSA